MHTKQHPPLAHDSHGRAIAIPDGTTHWRILRGAEPQPARFGLEMTRRDLLELCGPGIYGVEATDVRGKRIAEIAVVEVPPPGPDHEWSIEASAERKPRGLEVILDPDPARPRDDAWQLCITAYALAMMRARLDADERQPVELVAASEDKALEIVRRVLIETSPKTLAELLATRLPLLSPEDRLAALRGLPELQPEQLESLRTRLLDLSSTEGAVLLRTYVAPRTRAWSDRIEPTD